MNTFSRYWLHVSIYLLGTAAHAQNAGNLIINGNFDAQKVSTLSGFVYNIKSLGSDHDELADWESTNYSSPDYYATNAPNRSQTNPNSSVIGSFTPYNYSASPSAHNGCIGLVTIGYVNQPPSYSEYVTQKLAAPLSTSRTYYASMQVYRARVSEYVTTIGLDITTNNQIDYANGSNKHFVASGVGIQSPGYITAQQWTPVRGTFQGNGGQYINIGNLQPGNYQQTSPYIPTPQPHVETAYQYIDDVQVYPINIAGSDAIVYCGMPTTIGENYTIPGATYSWSTNPSTSSLPSTPQLTVNPAVSTVYTLTVTLPNGTVFSSSATVEVNEAEMYAIDSEDGNTCTNGGTIFYVPLYTPGPYDPAYAGTNGITWSISGQAYGGNWGPSPISGRPALWVVPNRSIIQPQYEVTMTYHYANGCTATNTNYLGWDWSVCYPYRQAYSVKPNPAASELVVARTPFANNNAAESRDASAQSPIEVRLYSSFGTLVKEGKTPADQLVIDVQDLPNGIYYLRSGTGKNAVSKAIEVRH